MPTRKSQEILTMLLLDGIQGARQTISACIYLDDVDLADILLQHYCFLHRATRSNEKSPMAVSCYTIDS